MDPAPPPHGEESNHKHPLVAAGGSGHEGRRLCPSQSSSRLATMISKPPAPPTAQPIQEDANGQAALRHTELGRMKSPLALGLVIYLFVWEVGWRRVHGGAESQENRHRRDTPRVIRTGLRDG